MAISAELLGWMDRDVEQAGDGRQGGDGGRGMAGVLRGVVMEYAGRVAGLREYLLAYWVPGDMPDCYMTMNL